MCARLSGMNSVDNNIMSVSKCWTYPVHHGNLSHGWTYYQFMHVTITAPCPVTHLQSGQFVVVSSLL